MRRFFFILMIALLPLRGWVGDAMAMQMALPGGMAHASAPETATGATHAHAHHGAAADHQRHAAASGDCTDHADGDATVSDAHCQTCTVCQTCHTVAITVPLVGTEATEPMTAAPLTAQSRFASADRAPGLKPPIS
ncbi:hypothetical protein O4H66_05915 [Comamonadaceae bacterium G21597-S1]|nr:hypothetical protein [Comamonadaceae bacterium G21597-S1]